jgi:peptidyl-prolyl cis-trans isomerase A (cyclophilin A)
MTKHAFFILFFSFLLSACGSGGDATPPSPGPEKKSSPSTPASDTKEQAPEKFAVTLETTKGDIIVDVTREWAPVGADRFYLLVRSGYYDDVAFFRVIPGFMAQGGISGKPELNAKWRTMRISDDPVKQSNTVGMVTFATGGANSRTTQIFINFGNNSRLDRMGFAPFGKVRDMKTVGALYSEYGEGAPRGRGPNQQRIQMEGNTYLRRDFPELDYIKTARIIE